MSSNETEPAAPDLTDSERRVRTMAAVIVSSGLSQNEDQLAEYLRTNLTRIIQAAPTGDVINRVEAVRDLEKLVKGRIEQLAEDGISEANWPSLLSLGDEVVSTLAALPAVQPATTAPPTEPEEAYCGNCRSHHLLPLCVEPEHQPKSATEARGEGEAMRRACVEKVREMQCEYDAEALATKDYERGASLGCAASALSDAITALESLPTGAEGDK